MDQAWSLLWDKGLPLGMLAVAIIYFYRLVCRKDERIEQLMREKDELHRENRDILQSNLTKTYEALNNNTIALNTLREVISK